MVPAQPRRAADIGVALDEIGAHGQAGVERQAVRVARALLARFGRPHAQRAGRPQVDLATTVKAYAGQGHVARAAFDAGIAAHVRQVLRGGVAALVPPLRPQARAQRAADRIGHDALERRAQRLAEHQAAVDPPAVPGLRQAPAQPAAGHLRIDAAIDAQLQSDAPAAAHGVFGIHVLGGAHLAAAQPQAGFAFCAAAVAVSIDVGAAEVQHAADGEQAIAQAQVGVAVRLARRGALLPNAFPADPGARAGRRAAPGMAADTAFAAQAETRLVAARPHLAAEKQLAHLLLMLGVREIRGGLEPRVAGHGQVRMRGIDRTAFDLQVLHLSFQRAGFDARTVMVRARRLAGFRRRRQDGEQAAQRRRALVLVAGPRLVHAAQLDVIDIQLHLAALERRAGRLQALGLDMQLAALRIQGAVTARRQPALAVVPHRGRDLDRVGLEPDILAAQLAALDADIPA
ncbi:Uncharacterised protein [Bordetella pertussis]|nr:Uncharacterised protein [Bordetella pertussis]CPK97344.1 Uncharacterised protein [Bordetella pertussis]CPL66536.1 Uncharacterised protein [Bordetella pertussis]CPL71755.1 Uncharacterised protein [Bordetella pertussis]